MDHEALFEDEKHRIDVLMEESLAIDGRPLELHTHQIKVNMEDDLDRENDDDYDFKILM